MKGLSVVMMASVFMLGVAGLAWGEEQVIQPAGAGPAEGSAYFPMEKGFDEQPEWNAETQMPVGGGEGDNAPAYKERFGYIDLGENWQNIRITQVWTKYRAWSGGDGTPFADLWWDDDKDVENDGGLYITEFNFYTAVGLPNKDEEQWVRDADLTESPVTPKGRYLMVSSGTDMNSRAKEFLLIGEVTPGEDPAAQEPQKPAAEAPAAPAAEEPAAE